MEKLKLLLVNPDFKRKINGQTPMNLAYLAAAVEKYAQVRIFDLNVKPPGELEKMLEDFKPTHVGITSYTPNCIDARKVLQKIHNQYPVVTLCGGPHEIFRGEITRQLYPWIDHVVTDAKAENALVKIITQKGHLHVDWRTIFHAYHLLDMDEPSYRFDQELFKEKKMLQYMSSRGCNMHCLFCPSKDYIPLENQTVIDHLGKIVEMGYEALFFNDVNFASLPIRTRNLMQLMIRDGLHRKLEWGCQTAAVKELPDKLLQIMKTAGCSYITFSLETASKKGLELIKKRIDPAIVAQKCRLAKSLGMQVGLYVMFGIHPEQTDWYWAQLTLDKVGEISPDYISYSVLADYPSANPFLDYEHVRFGTEDIWNFFDEGQAFHPNCSVEYAERLREEILKRHAHWPNMRIF